MRRIIPLSCLAGLLVCCCTLYSEDSKGRLTPAERGGRSARKSFTTQQYEQSPLVKSTTPRLSDDHKQAVNKLSPMNRDVFKTLNSEDQQKIVDDHKDGKDPHKAMTKILQDDQEDHEKNGAFDKVDKDDASFFWESSGKNTPAEKAIKKNDGKASNGGV